MSLAGVDEMRAKLYLTRIMLRRFLAAFALLTGLAAAGAPAQAHMLYAVSQQTDSASQNQQVATQTPCAPSVPKNGAANRTDSQADCRARKPVIIYLPTVQFGPDRALE